MNDHGSMPDRARTKSGHPSTSREAAAVVTVKLGSIRHRVLQELHALGACTDETLCDHLPGMASATVRGRRAELVAGGYVESVPASSITKRGNRCKVWKITDQGVNMILQHRQPKPTNKPAPRKKTLFG